VKRQATPANNDGLRNGIRTPSKKFLRPGPEIVEGLEIYTDG